GFVGLIGDPPAVRRESGVAVGGTGVNAKRATVLKVEPRFPIADERQRPELGATLVVQLAEYQRAAVGADVEGQLRSRRLAEPFGNAGTVGRGPVEIAHSPR